MGVKILKCSLYFLLLLNFTPSCPSPIFHEAFHDTDSSFDLVEEESRFHSTVLPPPEHLEFTTLTTEERRSSKIVQPNDDADVSEEESTITKPDNHPEFELGDSSTTEPIIIIHQRYEIEVTDPPKAHHTILIKTTQPRPTKEILATTTLQASESEDDDSTPAYGVLENASLARVQDELTDEDRNNVTACTHNPMETERPILKHSELEEGVLHEAKELLDALPEQLPSSDIIPKEQLLDQDSANPSNSHESNTVQQRTTNLPTPEAYTAQETQIVQEGVTKPGVEAEGITVDDVLSGVTKPVDVRGGVTPAPNVRVTHPLDVLVAITAPADAQSGFTERADVQAGGTAPVNPEITGPTDVLEEQRNPADVREENEQSADLLGEVTQSADFQMGTTKPADNFGGDTISPEDSAGTTKEGSTTTEKSLDEAKEGTDLLPVVIPEQDNSTDVLQNIKEALHSAETDESKGDLMLEDTPEHREDPSEGVTLTSVEEVHQTSQEEGPQVMSEDIIPTTPEPSGISERAAELEEHPEEMEELVVTEIGDQRDTREVEDENQDGEVGAAGEFSVRHGATYYVRSAVDNVCLTAHMHKFMDVGLRPGIVTAEEFEREDNQIWDVIIAKPEDNSEFWLVNHKYSLSELAVIKKELPFPLKNFLNFIPVEGKEMLIKSIASGNCVQYQGKHDRIIYAPCDQTNKSQQWTLEYLYEEEKVQP